MKLNLKIIIHFFGLLLLFNGAFMLLASLISSLYNDEVTLEIFIAGITVLVIGGIFMISSLKHKKEMNKREGYVVVTFGWIMA